MKKWLITLLFPFCLSCSYKRTAYINNEFVVGVQTQEYFQQGLEDSGRKIKFYNHRYVCKISKDSIYSLFTKRNRLLAKGRISYDSSKHYFVKQKNWIFYYRNQSIALTGNYLSDLQTDTFRLYFKNGRINSVEQYVIVNKDTIIGDSLLVMPIHNSLRNGRYLTFYKNGQKCIEGNYEVMPGIIKTLVYDFKNKKEHLYVPFNGFVSVKSGEWKEYNKKGIQTSHAVIVSLGVQKEE
ncbi:MAG: hypothetical protein ACHQF2_08555 [Flavobacteriales bacterium]